MTTQPLVSVIMPFLNEASTLRPIIHAIFAQPYAIELLGIDDGSTDSSASVFLELAKSYPNKTMRLFTHTENRGKGSAIRTALPHARGDIVLIQDADLEYNPADYKQLLEPLLANRAQVVYGSRNTGNNQGGMRLYKWGIAALTHCANMLYGLSLTDIGTCYKAFRREVICSLPLQCTGFEFCPEVTARIARKGIRIAEAPISYIPRTHAQGKKISMRDGVRWLWVLIKLAHAD